MSPKQRPKPQPGISNRQKPKGNTSPTIKLHLKETVMLLKPGTNLRGATLPRNATLSEKSSKRRGLDESVGTDKFNL